MASRAPLEPRTEEGRALGDVHGCCSGAGVDGGARVASQGRRLACRAAATRDGVQRARRVRPRPPPRSRRLRTSRPDATRRRIAHCAHAARGACCRAARDAGIAVGRADDVGARDRVRMGQRMASAAQSRLGPASARSLEHAFWRLELRYRDHRGTVQQTHHPDLAVRVTNGLIAVEVELQRKAARRQRGICAMYKGLTDAHGPLLAVIYVTDRNDVSQLVERTAAQVGLREPEPGFREMHTLVDQTYAAADEHAAIRARSRSSASTRSWTPTMSPNCCTSNAQPSSTTPRRRTARQEARQALALPTREVDDTIHRLRGTYPGAR